MKKCFMCCLRWTWWFLYCYVPSLHKHIIVTFLQIVSSETHICSNLLFLTFDVTIYNFASGVLSHETFIYNAHTWSNVHAYNLIESVPRLCFSIKKLWCMVGNECAVNNKSNLKMNKCYMSVLIIRTTMQMTIVFLWLWFWLPPSCNYGCTAHIYQRCTSTPLYHSCEKMVFWLTWQTWRFMEMIVMILLHA